MKLSSVKRAAIMLGRSDQFVRTALQQRKLSIGFAVKMGANQYTYHINERELQAYLGEVAYQEGLQKVEEYNLN